LSYFDGQNFLDRFSKNISVLYFMKFRPVRLQFFVWKDEQTHGRTDGRTDVQTDRQTDRQ
jgi:hypothetical protein